MDEILEDEQKREKNNEDGHMWNICHIHHLLLIDEIKAPAMSGTDVPVLYLRNLDLVIEQERDELIEGGAELCNGGVE